MKLRSLNDTRQSRVLKERGLKGVKLVISDKAAGLADALGDFFPEAQWQRCVVHWYRNAFNKCPYKHVKTVSAMLKAIHAQEDKEAAREKAGLVAAKLRTLKLESLAKFVEESVEETLSCMDFPTKHWRKIMPNNGLERIMKEIRRRPRVVGSFPAGFPAMMLVGARLRHISTTKWGTLQSRLQNLQNGCIIRNWHNCYNQSKRNVRKIPDTT